MAHSECHSIKRVFVLGMYYITIRHISSTSFNLTSHHTYGYDFLHLLAFPLSFSFYRVRIPSSLRHVQSNECFAFCQGRFSFPKREWKLWDCVCVFVFVHTEQTTRRMKMKMLMMSSTTVTSPLKNGNDLMTMMRYCQCLLPACLLPSSHVFRQKQQATL